MARESPAHTISNHSPANPGMREYATRRGWRIALVVKEIGSGASQREQREKLLQAARRQEIDVVLLWRLNRWGRSVTDLLATLQELARASGRRFCFTDRGVGSHDARRSSHGRPAGGLRRIRAGESAVTRVRAGLAPAR